MSAQRVITQVVTSEPLFITISHQPAWFGRQFSGGGISWLHVPSSTTFSSSELESIREAHRIVLDISLCTPEERKYLVLVLLPHQEKLKLIFPIYSFWQLNVPGEIPGWEIATNWQAGQIFHWTSSLPETTIIFVRDVFDWQATPTLITLLTQFLADELLFAPQGKLACCQKDSISHILLEEFGAPPRGSIVLQSKEYLLSSLLEQAVPLYTSMHQVKIRQQLVETNQLQLLPFPCRIRELDINRNIIVNLLTNLFPPPSQFDQLKQQTPTLLAQLQADPWLLTTATTTNKPQKLQAISSEHAGSNQPKAIEQSHAAIPIVTSTEPPPLQIVTEVEKGQQLKEDVRKLFSVQGVTRHNLIVQQKSTQRKLVKKRSRKRTAVFYLGLLFVSIGLLLAALLGSLQITQQLANHELVAVGKGISESTTTSSETVRWGQLPLLVTMMRAQHTALAAVFSLPLLDASQNLLTTHAQLHAALQLKDQLVQNNYQLYAILTGHSKENLQAAITTFTQDEQKALQLSKDLTISINQLAEPVGKPVASAAASLLPSPENKRRQLLQNTLFPRLATLAGTERERHYAVVLQNSQELRPTGGFIEAIAILTFKNGGLINQEVHSIYDLDARLPHQTKPPQDLTTILGENQWWPHDANWSADAALSAKQISLFLESTLKQSTDGVIFINTAGLPQLLRYLGPLEMPGYSEVLTDKNIGERLEFHNELPSQVVVGTADYRQSLLTNLLHKLISLPPEQIPTFYQVLDSLLEEKQLIATFNSTEDQLIFRQLGWAGEMTFPVCPSDYTAGACVSDGIALVESNVGFNRANAYIKRAQTHQAVLGPSGVHHTRTIQYTNTATTNAWPKGDYKMYMRVYVPGRPTNILLTANGIPLTAKEVTIRDSEIGAEIAFMVTVPIASTKDVVLTYDQSQALSSTSTYVFFENRQAGLTEPSPSFQLSFPVGWQVATHVPEAALTGSEVIFPQSTTPYLMRVVQFAPAQ